MEPKGNPNVPGDRKINKKTAASSATVKPNSKSPASSPIVSSALSMKSKAETALIHEEQGSCFYIGLHSSDSFSRAVLLTDGVFWFIIYPFLTSKEFNLDFFIVIKHSVNAVFLLGETFLNSLVSICILSLLKHNNMMMVILL
ncbi:BnaCnng10950D [Brassica napus]|uniref:BnaCnng10950D protein n=1 Tax=Brassica napus TaxID=3708 RepID=A0A078HZ48_BRANA|nr:BnaCnng10950D [Brassica napus]